MNATNLQYKYPRDTRFDTTTNPAELEKRNGKPANKSKLDLSQIIKNIFQGIKAIGKPQDVIITWYIGITIGVMVFVCSCCSILKVHGE